MTDFALKLMDVALLTVRGPILPPKRYVKQHPIRADTAAVASGCRCLPASVPSPQPCCNLQRPPPYTAGATISAVTTAPSLFKSLREKDGRYDTSSPICAMHE